MQLFSWFMGTSLSEWNFEVIIDIWYYLISPLKSLEFLFWRLWFNFNFQGLFADHQFRLLDLSSESFLVYLFCSKNCLYKTEIFYWYLELWTTLNNLCVEPNLWSTFCRFKSNRKIIFICFSFNLAHKPYSIFLRKTGHHHCHLLLLKPFSKDVFRLGKGGFQIMRGDDEARKWIWLRGIWTWMDLF